MLRRRRLPPIMLFLRMLFLRIVMLFLRFLRVFLRFLRLRRVLAILYIPKGDFFSCLRWLEIRAPSLAKVQDQMHDFGLPKFRLESALREVEPPEVWVLQSYPEIP